MEIVEGANKYHLTILDGSFSCTCKMFRTKGRCNHIKKYRSLALKGVKRVSSKDTEKEEDIFNLKECEKQISERLKDTNKDK